MLKDIENEEILFQSKKRRKALRLAAAEQVALKRQENEKDGDIEGDLAGKTEVESINGVRFY